MRREKISFLYINSTKKKLVYEYSILIIVENTLVEIIINQALLVITKKK